MDDFFDPFHTLIVNHTDEDDLSPPQKLMPNGPLKRGQKENIYSTEYLKYFVCVQETVIHLVAVRSLCRIPPEEVLMKLMLSKKILN